ncbi:hypothetical protein QR680_004117 [Steinernema hermaphroditum]|uniref:NTR domain-containing protein n=1 Tax=Steinernema hermaphroditum TaxID=289476 RepID=A0AA39LTH5_9BILA|nr:hypothetical protein QR680_004117 [Steinernema hermaphroditum]
MFLTFHLLAAFLSVTFGCTCVEPSTDGKQEFCMSDFVGIFKILKRSETTERVIQYHVAPSQIFKSPGGHSDINVLETYKHGASCGVTGLEEGQEYLLTGFYSSADNAFSIYICGEIALTQWSNVPTEIRKALKEGSYEPCPNQD